jgi:hypothetical protein
MGNWLLNLPIPLMTVVVLALTYAVAAAVYLIVTGLAVDERGRAFKAVSPGMLPPLGIVFGLLVGFVAVQVWSDFDRGKLAVANEASALRAMILLAASLPDEEKTRIVASIQQHVDIAVNQEWPAMAKQQANLSMLPTALIDVQKDIFAFKPADDNQRLAQQEIVRALNAALEARRQRIIISQSTVSGVKWAGILLQGLCALIAIAMVHSDNRLACRIVLALFATGIALSVLLIATYASPFSGDISIKPELLKEVVI